MSVAPFYEDFFVGQVIDPLPNLMITEAHNVTYQSLIGDQNALIANPELFGSEQHRIVHSGLVAMVSIGQTTNATRRVIANLYYRKVRFHRPVHVGEVLSTTTTVLGLRDSSPKEGRTRGKVWLGIETTAGNEPVMTYERVALLRSQRSEAEPLGHGDEIPGPDEAAPFDELSNLVPDWDLSRLAETDWQPGETRKDLLRDFIDGAGAIVRLTFNQASLHRDHTASPTDGRLVFGLHVQALAQASLSRLLPGMATVVAWDGCDALGPSHEGDLLEFDHTLIDSEPAGTGQLMRFRVTASRVSDNGDATPVLAWTPIVFAH